MTPTKIAAELIRAIRDERLQRDTLVMMANDLDVALAQSTPAPPTTDTRAALDAAIDRIADVWTSFMRTREVHPTAPIELADWMAPKTLTDPLRTAITAHVEAEVARRLAAAPGVEEAIEMLGDTCYERGHVHAGGLPDDSVRSIDRDAAEATLRAAIAADRGRAVDSATAHMRPMVSREQAAQLVARFEESIGHELRRRIDGDRKDLIGALTGGEDAPARPTPDEARRMINELIGSMAVVGNGLDDSPGAVVAKRIAADARTALLRALGVEA